MKKRLLGILLLVSAICLSISIDTNVLAFAAELEENKVSVEYFDNANRSIEIYEQVMNQCKQTVVHNGEEITVYNDDFSGVYIDKNGVLNIGLLDLNQSNLRFGGQVLYQQHRFSYNLLLQALEKLTYVMTEYDIFTVGIDEEKNHLFVDMSDERDINPIVELLREEGLYVDGMLNFNIDVNLSNEANANTAYGGDKINDSVLFLAGGYGTICVNAYDYDTGKYGVLTNEHVAGSDTMYHDGNVFQGSKIGKATKSQNSGTIDAAFIPFDNQNNWNTTTHSKNNSTTYTNIRLGAENLIIQGAPVRRLGQKTNDTTGTITVVNTSINSGGIVKSNVFRYSNAGKGGDSGGPVYVTSGGNNFLVGMHFSSTAEKRDDGTIIPEEERNGTACRISNVMSAFNVTPITNGGLFYTADLPNNEIRIDGLAFNPTGALVIPKVLNGRTVTEIDVNAFKGQTGITSVSFESGSQLKSMGNYAFKNCTNLKTVSGMPGSVTAMGINVFSGCTELTSVNIPTGITGIEYGTFRNCAKLASITIPSNVKSIGSHAFEGCVKLTKATIPSGVTTIKSSAFSGCTALSSVNIPSGVKTIESNTFKNCINISGISLPNTVTTIEAYAFQGCTKLASINIPSGVTSIEGSTFKNCSALSNLTLNDNITNIGGGAFLGCGGLDLSDIGSLPKVITVGSGAFSGTAVNAFVITYEKDGQPGNMPVTVAGYGANVTTRSNTFTASSGQFAGWNAYRDSDGTWQYVNPSNTTQKGWYKENLQPSGWEKYVYANNAVVSSLGAVNGDIIRFSAKFEAVTTCAISFTFTNDRVSVTGASKVTYGGTYTFEFTVKSDKGVSVSFIGVAGNLTFETTTNLLKTTYKYRLTNVRSDITIVINVQSYTGPKPVIMGEPVQPETQSLDAIIVEGYKEE